MVWGRTSSKVMEIPRGGGSTVKPLEQKIMEGVESKKKKPSMGGMIDIFWNHTRLQLRRFRKDAVVSKQASDCQSSARYLIVCHRLLWS